MIYEQEHSIFDRRSLYRKFQTAETKFEVLEGKIASIISDSEIDYFVDGSSTMFSRLNAAIDTINGHTRQVSELTTRIDADNKTINNMISRISLVEQTAREFSASVSESFTNVNADIGDLQDWVKDATVKIRPDSIVATVRSAESYQSDLSNASTAGADSAKSWAQSQFTIQDNRITSCVKQYSDGSFLTSKIVQSPDNIQLIANNINLRGALSVSAFDDSTKKVINSHDMRFFTSNYEWTQTEIDETKAVAGKKLNWTVNESTSGLLPGNTVLIRFKNTTKDSYSWMMCEVVSEPTNDKVLYATTIGVLEKGDIGTVGIGVSEIVNYYLASDRNSGITTDFSEGWSTDVKTQTTTKEKPYLWNFEITRYTDNGTQYTQPHIIGTYGEDGRSIVSVDEYYKAWSDGEQEPPENSFIKNQMDPISPANKYLWNYEVINYSEGDPSKTNKRIIGVYGDSGDPGRGIDHIDNWYLACDESSGITVDSTSGTGWVKGVVQTTDADKPYLWNYEATTYTDDLLHPENSEPHIVGMFTKDGKGISGITEYYALSATATAPDTGWTNLTVPAPDSTNRYLWNYEIITYTDGDTLSTQKHIVGVYGNAGKGIDHIENMYLACDKSSGVTRTSTYGTGWKNTVQTITATNRYLWNYENVYYTDDPTKAVPTDPVLVGTFAKAVSTIEEYYARSKDASGTDIESFTTTVKSVTSTYKYLWNYEIVRYTDGTTEGGSTKKRIIGVYGENGQPGVQGISIVSTKTQYCLATSLSDAKKSTTVWTDAPPNYDASKYYYERTVTVLKDPANNNAESTVTSTPVLSGLNTAINKAAAAQTTANNANNQATSAVSTANSASKTASTANNNATNALDKANAADQVLAQWAKDNNKTYINGAKIYTGTVTADKLAAKAITAEKIDANAITATKIKADAFVGKELYTSGSRSSLWNRRMHYRNAASQNVEDRESFRDKNTWSSTIPSYNSSYPYLWAYADLDDSKSIPVCIGFRKSSGISYYRNVNVSLGKIWTYNNENYLSLDGPVTESNINDRAYFAAGSHGWVSVGKYVAASGVSPGSSPVEIISDHDILLDPGGSGVSGYEVLVSGNFSVANTKSRIVKDTLYGDRLLYSYETPTPMFGDVGLGRIDENGYCTVSIDDIFNETVNTGVEYAVFLQKEGPGDCWVAEKDTLYFTVQGTPGLKFAWELKAVQKGYEDRRLDDHEIDKSFDPIDDDLQADLDKEMEELLNAETYSESVSGD